MSKKYKHICAHEIEDYEGWELVQVLPLDKHTGYLRAIIMKEDAPIQNYIKLHEATDEQLVEELMKRLKEAKNEN